MVGWMQAGFRHMLEVSFLLGDGKFFGSVE